MDKSTFEDAMYRAAVEYFDLLKKKESIDTEIGILREQLQGTLRAANRDTFDIPSSPLVITYKMKKTAERMKKGGKAILKGMITEFEWSEIYSPPGIAQSLVVKRRDKMRD